MNFEKTRWKVSTKSDGSGLENIKTLFTEIVIIQIIKFAQEIIYVPKSSSLMPSGGFFIYCSRKFLCKFWLGDLLDPDCLHFSAR